MWRGTDAATSDNCIRIPRGPMTYTQECTFEVLFRLNTLASSGNIGIMSQYQTVSGVDVYGPNMGFTTGFGVSRINFAVRTGAVWRTATSGSASTDGIAAGQLAHVVCTASVAAGSILNIYINAVNKGGASFFSGSFVNDPNNFLSLLSRYVDGGGNNCAGIDMYLARVYNVAKSPTEIQALYKDPWGMFTQTQFLHTDSTPSPTSRTFFVPRRKVMSTQPANSMQIDWGNSITRGLVTAYIPTYSTGLARDLVSGIYDSATVRLPVGPGLNGVKVFNTGASTTWGINFVSSILWPHPNGIAPYTALSTFALFEQYDTTSFGSIFGGGNNATNHARFVKESDGSIFFVPNTNSGTPSVIYSPVLDTNRVYALAGVSEGNYRELFVDAVSVASANTSITFVGSAFTYAGSVYITNQFRRIGLYCGYVWTRRLTPSEIKSLSDNPWQIFKQPRLSPALAEDGKVYAPFMS